MGCLHHHYWKAKWGETFKYVQLLSALRYSIGNKHHIPLLANDLIVITITQSSNEGDRAIEEQNSDPIFHVHIQLDKMTFLYWELGRNSPKRITLTTWWGDFNKIDLVYISLSSNIASLPPSMWRVLHCHTLTGNHLQHSHKWLHNFYLNQPRQGQCQPFQVSRAFLDWFHFQLTRVNMQCPVVLMWKRHIHWVFRTTWNLQPLQARYSLQNLSNTLKHASAPTYL